MIGRRGSRKSTPNGDVDVRHDISRGAALRARGLCRVSDPNKVCRDDPTDPTGDDISLPKQIQRIKDFCDRNELNLTGIHWDVAGGESASRPGYLRLIDGGYNDEYDVIVVWMADRLCRGITAAAPLALMWERTQRRIKVISIADDFDMHELAMYAWAAQRESELIRRRTSDARLERAKRGEIVSFHLPYWLGRGPDKKGVLLPEHANAMRQAIARYMAGEGTSALCDWMRANAPSHPSKRSRWSSMALLTSFRYKALYGSLEYSARRAFTIEDPQSGATIVELRRRDDFRDPRITPEDMSTIVDIPVPPLLHQSDAEKTACDGCGLCVYEGNALPSFEELQREISRRRRPSRGAGHPPYPLRKLVFCRNCDTLMTARFQHSYYRRDANGRWEPRAHKRPVIFLRCSGMHKSRIDLLPCRRQRDINGRAVWEFVKGHLRSFLLHTGVPWQTCANAIQLMQTRPSPSDSADIDLHLSRAKNDQVELFTRRTEYHPDVYRELNLRLLRTIELYETELTRHLAATEIRPAAIDSGLAANSVIQPNRTDDLDELDDDQWREIVLALVARIEIDSAGQPHVKWRQQALDEYAGEIDQFPRPPFEAESN